MAEALLKISADKMGFVAETPDASWAAEQFSEDGLNFLHDDDEPEGPLYLVVSENYEGSDGPKANTVYELVPLVTTVVPNADLGEENGENTNG
jgi:hypothetical protein